MLEWLLENWPSLVTASGLLTVASSAIRYGPRCLRRFALMMDCEMDRLRWEEADKLRNREIALLRQDVANLQGDIARLLARSGASGPDSGGATPATAPTTPTSRPPS